MNRLLHSPTRAIAAAVLLLLLAQHSSVAALNRETLPASLTDREFWSLTQQLSEPDGYFRSTSGSPDNLLSNEATISTVAAMLAARVKPMGVYLGVGPEQNFTYIAATRPHIAFITDIRRGNLHLHLLYKAIFEMSANRADFVARLFCRKRPDGLTGTSSASDVMNAYLGADALDEAGFKANLKAALDHLTKTRSLPLDDGDRTGIEYVYRNFYQFGPAINYTSSINGRAGSSGSYAAIQSATDRASGAERTYLANETYFGLVKAMEQKNLIVPIVGDFAGPKALRSVGAWLRDKSVTVSAFYVSNVEMYLERNGVWPAFCANVAALPLDSASVFIRPGNRGGADALSPMQAETAACKAPPRSVRRNPR